MTVPGRSGAAGTTCAAIPPLPFSPAAAAAASDAPRNPRLEMFFAALSFIALIPDPFSLFDTFRQMISKTRAPG